MNAGEGGSSQTTLLQSGLELRSRLVLDEGLSRIDAHTRSRLNRARQAAVAAAAKPSFLSRFHWAWTRQVMMPATGAAAAAALVAVFVLSSAGHHLTASTDTPTNALDVLDLVTDDDAMNLMDDNDGFYEWAAEQGDGAGQGVGQNGGEATT